MRSLYLKLKVLWKRRQLDRDLQDELAYHRELRGAASPVPFGNATVLRENLRDLWTFTAFEDVWRDVRHALRVLRRSPVYSMAIVLLLTVGIGANVAIFSLVNALLIRTLPVERPEELAIVQRVDSLLRENNWSVPMYDLFLNQQKSFSKTFAWQAMPAAQLKMRRSDVEDVPRVLGAIVTGNYFDVLGIRAQIGRTFTAEDDHYENPNAVMVLSHDFWVRQFGQDPGAIGREVFLGGRPLTVIGVMPPETRRIGGDFWVPLNLQPLIMPGGDRRRVAGSAWLQVMGRLKPGVSIERANAEARVIYEPFRVRTKAPEGSTLRATDGRHGFDAFRTQYGTPLRILLGTVGLLLLIACANIASLMLARAGARQKETAVRQALGCSRWRLVRQSLIESGLLAAAGTALGLAIAVVGVREILALAGPAAVRGIDASLDGTVLLFALSASVFAVMLFGLAPAIRASQLSFDSALKSGSRTSTASRQPMNRLIVIGQTALCVVLVTGSALFGRSLYKLYNMDAGFDRQQVITASINTAAFGYTPEDERYPILAGRVIERLSAVPGVRSVSVAAAGFLTGSARGLGGIVVDGQPVKGILRINQVSHDFLSALGVRLLEGRAFDSRERAGSPRVAVVNQTFARTYFPGGQALGKRFWAAEDPSQSAEIVGVVQDSKYNDFREQTEPLVFFALEQLPQRFNHIQMKVQGSAASLIPEIRRAILEVDPRLRPTNVETLDASLDRVVSRDILLARLSGLFGAIALLLACFGIYGMISHAVAERTAEIGIRMALGAQPNEVRRGIIGDALRVVAPGVVIGVLAALAVERYVESFLFGISGRDPLTYIAVTTGLLVTALLAAYLPGRRASRIDPVIALRCE